MELSSSCQALLTLNALISPNPSLCEYSEYSDLISLLLIYAGFSLLCFQGSLISRDFFDIYSIHVLAYRFPRSFWHFSCSQSYFQKYFSLFFVTDSLFFISSSKIFYFLELQGLSLFILHPKSLSALQNSLCVLIYFFSNISGPDVSYFCSYFLTDSYFSSSLPSLNEYLQNLHLLVPYFSHQHGLNLQFTKQLIYQCSWNLAFLFLFSFSLHKKSKDQIPSTLLQFIIAIFLDLRLNCRYSGLRNQLRYVSYRPYHRGHKSR